MYHVALIANERIFSGVFVRLLRFEMAKRTILSLLFKMDVIKKFEENSCTSKNALAEHFSVPEWTLRGILKNREAITVAHRECGIQSKKKAEFKVVSPKNLRKFWLYGLTKLVPQTFLLTLIS